MNNKIRKLQLGDYFLWNNLSREDKVKRNKQIALLYLDKGPSILNYYNALKAYFGGFNPKNPYLLTGEPIILPGTNPTKGVLTAAKAVRTLEDYLKTTKVAAPVLEGNSAARSAYATDRYIGGRLFLNKLPDEAMKVQGHGMSKSPSLQDALARLRYMLDNGLEKGKTFYTAPLKVSEEAARAGEAIGTGGATPYFDGHFLITGKPGQMINSIDDIGTIYINDAYENEEALKAAQKMKEYLTKTYPNKVFKLYSEGFKKGGSIKTANARKWKHEKGGELIKKALEGTKLNFGLKVGNFIKSDFGKSAMSMGLNLLSNKLFNLGVSSESEIAKSQVDSEQANEEQQAVALALAQTKLALANLENPDNPNANGGDIVKSNLYLKFLSLNLIPIQLKSQAKKAQIDMQTQLFKNQKSLEQFGQFVNTGLDLVNTALNHKKV